MLTKSVFENIKSGINGRGVSRLLFKYYIRNLGGWGVLVCADRADAGGWGWGVQNYGKHADIILERSFTMNTGI